MGLKLCFQCIFSPTRRENAPGQQECDQAGDMINRAINKIDQASLAAISNNLKPTTEGSLKVPVTINYQLPYIFHFRNLSLLLKVTEF